MEKLPDTRTEKDALGSVEVPADAYYGIFTQRAMRNFRISGIRAERNFIKALALIKKAAAAANAELGLLEERAGGAIVQAAVEVADGKYDDGFPLDVFQAGAGTPFNMNCNEVIANLANEKLGAHKGSYVHVHPNNHVNMAQSSNDVIPAAIRIAVLLSTPRLLEAAGRLSASFRKKAAQYWDVVKTGRTHLQDAVPITFGQVFESYARAIDDCIRLVKNSEGSLLRLGLGGTAVGTGINAHPEFRQRAISKLMEYTGLNLSAAPDTVLTAWSMTPFLEFSNSLRILAGELVKMSNDLMLLGSGPKTAVAEIKLPEVEPGSSIMPGKINPSVPECAIMACYQVLGNDHAVAEAAKAGQLELNVMTPLIAFDLLWSVKLLANTMQMLHEHCIAELTVDSARSRELLEKGLSLVTALNPYVGYEVAAEVVKIALRENKPLTSVLAERNIMTADDMGKVLNAKAMTRPGIIDKELQARIRSSSGFLRFRELL